MTLYTALVTISKAAAPMIPFMTEQIYRNLVCNIDKTAPESVHLCSFPEVQEEYIDTQLEDYMDVVLKVVVMGRACRNTANIKNRQPIGKMFVKSETQLPHYYQTIITEELNVKEIQFTEDMRSFTSYSFKPQMRTVGPKYGKLLNQIKQTLSEINGNEAMDTLNADGQLTFTIGEQEVVLTKDDLLIDTAQMPGYVSEQDKTLTVVLDTNLTPELLEEGFVREISSKLQTMRKEAGFEVTDHITVYQQGNDTIKALMEKYTPQIQEAVLADAIVLDKLEGYQKTWNINKESVTLGVAKN
jgi:isoleucyl-tRNA synthetase